MDQRIIIANWKMNTGFSEALGLTKKIAQETKKLKNINIVLCPPFIWLYPLSKILKKLNSRIELGGQNVYFENKGNFTGEISPLMLKRICRYVIIGHSERRRFLAETDEMINKKFQAVLKNGLRPILCVGEFEKTEISENHLYGSVFQQLGRAIKGVTKENIKKAIIAYEPVWAIGTGKPATGKYAAEMIVSLRDRLSIIYNRKIAREIKILYGGSVDAGNILEFIRQPGIDGVLAGGASLKVKEFLKICEMVGKNNK